MPQNISSDILIKGTNPFGPKTTNINDKEKEAQGVSGDAVLTEIENNRVDKSRLKLPSIAKRTTLSDVYDDGSNDLQVLLRVRCFDFPLQVHGLKPEWTDESETGSSASSLASSGQDRNKTATEGERYGNDIQMKAKKVVLPLSSSTVLEGQRVNLRGKEGLPKQRKTKEANSVPCGTDPSCQEIDKAKSYNVSSLKSEQQIFQPPMMADKFHGTTKYHVSRPALKSIADRWDSRLWYHTDSRSSIASLKPVKQRTRPTLQLPQADKYDINPKNVVEVKVCSVFKGNALKTMLIYSGHNDSWNPNRDNRLLKNAVLKALMQQPAMFLRQPLPEDGLKMALKGNDASLAKAKFPCKRGETVDNKVTREVKKFVVRLPSIC